MKIGWGILIAVSIGLSLIVIIVAGVLPVGTPSTETVAPQYDEQWCEKMMAIASSDWREEQIVAFSQNCLDD